MINREQRLQARVGVGGVFCLQQFTRVVWKAKRWRTVRDAACSEPWGLFHSRVSSGEDEGEEEEEEEDGGAGITCQGRFNSLK